MMDSGVNASSSLVYSGLALGTIVRIHVASQPSEETLRLAVPRALEAFQAVERACSRFDEDSELVRLVREPAGTKVAVGPVLFQSLQFACKIADWTQGRFDPTVGAQMEELGFRRHYLTGESVAWTTDINRQATFRDIELDAQNQTVRLHRPLLLDLGAVAKGLAVDLAVKELAAFDFPGFVVDAGGDLYAAGTDGDGNPWPIGIRHPVQRDKSIWVLPGVNTAVCTSGTYERVSPNNASSHHILDTQSMQSARGFLSITATGPFAMMADAFSTAAFFYSPKEALELLEEAGLEGVIVTEDLEVKATSGMEGSLVESV